MKTAIYIACILFGAIIGCVLVAIVQSKQPQNTYVEYQDEEPPIIDTVQVNFQEVKVITKRKSQSDNSKVFFYKRF